MSKLASIEVGDLLYLAFITEGGTPLFEMSFQVEGGEYSSDLITGFVSAIQSFSKEISDGDLKVIDQGDVKICFEEGKKASLIFMASSETERLRKKMRSLLDNFELRYQTNLKKAGEAVDPSAFIDFRETAMQILADDVIKSYYIVDFSSKTPPEKVDEEFWPVITSINGRRTVSEIAKHANMNLQSVVEIIASLSSQDIVNFQIMVETYDIPVLTPKGMSQLFKLTPEQLKETFNLDKEDFQIIKAIDGKNTINNLAEKSKKELSILKTLIKSLLARDYVELVSEEYRVCLIMETMYNYFLHIIKSTMGEQAVKMFRDTLNAEQDTYAKLIKFEGNEISFEGIKTYMKSQEEINLLEMIQSLSSTLVNILKIVETTFGSKQVKKMKSQVIDKLKTNFGPKDIDTIEKSL